MSLTFVSYKSGRPAVVSTAAGIGFLGFCTIMYDDDQDNTMLGCFTASGQGCCYHSNGLVNLLVTETGGTIADEYGVITRRWDWPPGHGAKLATAIQVSVRKSPVLLIKIWKNNTFFGTKNWKYQYDFFIEMFVLSHQLCFLNMHFLRY